MTPEERHMIMESGLLELYVAGACSPDEARTVKDLVMRDPAIAREVESIRLAVESYAHAHRREPRRELKTRVLDAVDAVSRTSEETGHANVVPLSPRRRYLLVASVAFVIGLLPGIYFMLESRHYRHAFETTMTQLADVQQQRSVIAARASSMERAIDQLADTNVVRIVMPGLPSAASSFATVWWNRRSQEVYLDLHRMPSISSNEDYQLWAIVDGKPVDLGTFNPAAAAAAIVRMKQVGTPQAFAVTIEPKGGRTTPTLERMVVLGKV